MNRIVQLPIGLAPDDVSMWLACLARRNQITDANFRLYLCREFTFNGGPLDSYIFLVSQKTFAWHGLLTSSFLAAADEVAVGNSLPATLPPGCPNTNPFPLVAGLEIQLDGPDLILDEATDFDSLCGDLLAFVDDEILSLSTADLTDTGAYSLTVVRGFFGTAIADHQAGAHIFICRRLDVLPLSHPYFQSGNQIKLKLAIGAADVSNAIPFSLTLPESSGIGWGIELL
jgi:hypothetical protein